MKDSSQVNAVEQSVKRQDVNNEQADNLLTQQTDTQNNTAPKKTKKRGRPRKIKSINEEQKTMQSETIQNKKDNNAVQDTIKQEQQECNESKIDEEQLKVLQEKLNQYVDIDVYWKHLSTSQSDIRNGCPTEHYLSKLFEAFYGHITNSVITEIDGGIILNVTIQRLNGSIETHQSVGEFNKSNCEFPYSTYPRTMALTRAYARLYRRLLNISQVGREEVNEDIINKELSTTQNIPTATIGQEESNTVDKWILPLIHKKAKEKRIDLTEIVKVQFQKQIDELDKQELQQIYMLIKSM